MRKAIQSIILIFLFSLIAFFGGAYLGRMSVEAQSTTDPAASASGMSAIEATFFSTFRDAFTEVSQDHSALLAVQSDVSSLKTDEALDASGIGTLAAGRFVHVFASSYSAQPACFAEGMSVTNNAIIAVATRAEGTTTGNFTQVMILSSLATDTEQVSWHCQPQRN